MRLIGIAASCFYLAYCMTIKNYVGILEIFVIISNISAYRMYLKDKKNIIINKFLGGKNERNYF